jgi:hypothetical protein
MKLQVFDLIDNIFSCLYVIYTLNYRVYQKNFDNYIKQLVQNPKLLDLVSYELYLIRLF